MNNFIKGHIIGNIKRLYKKYDDVMKIEGINKFIYFDEPIKTSRREFNRITSFFPYAKDEITNSGWHSLNGPELREMWEKLRDNKVYILKNIDGHFYKIRKKV